MLDEKTGCNRRSHPVRSTHKSVSNSALSWARPLPVKGPAKAVLIALADHANMDDECWPSHATLANDTGLARSTVIKALAALRAQGLIEWHNRYQKAGDKSSNLYRLLRGSPTAGQGSPTVGQGLSANRTGVVRHSDGRGPGAGHKPSLNPQESNNGNPVEIAIGGRRGFRPIKIKSHE